VTGGTAVALPIFGSLAALLASLTVFEMFRAGLAPGRVFGNWLEPFIRTIDEGHVPNLRERLGLICSIGVVAVITGWVLGGAVAASVLAGLVPLTVAWLIGRATVRYRRSVDRGLPVAARALADSLTAGQAPRAALVTVVQGLDGEVAFEMGRVARDLVMGLPTDQALDRMARRVGTGRVNAFAGAITSLTLSGGDLAGLMRRFADGALERDRMADEARTATAQARFTGFLVAVLPIGAGLFIELTGLGLFASLRRSGVAVALLLLALALQACGFLVISRVARVSQP
jgi:tight adherence protein B